MSLSQKVKAEWKGSINNAIEFEEKNIKFEIGIYKKRYRGNANPSNTTIGWFIKLIQHNHKHVFISWFLIIIHFFY